MWKPREGLVNPYIESDKVDGMMRGEAYEEGFDASHRADIAWIKRFEPHTLSNNILIKWVHNQDGSQGYTIFFGIPYKEWQEFIQ